DRHVPLVVRVGIVLAAQEAGQPQPEPATAHARLLPAVYLRPVAQPWIVALEAAVVVNLLAADALPVGDRDHRRRTPGRAPLEHRPQTAVAVQVAGVGGVEAVLRGVSPVALPPPDPPYH